VPFFVIQTQSRGEARLLGAARRRNPAIRERLIWPRRQLRVRRKGQWHDTLAPIFPGYVFLQADEVDTATYWDVKGLTGFVRFLESNSNILPLSRSDAELLAHFLSFGETVGNSVVTFDEQRRIRVTSGPLRGMEGRIVKVDRRKGRARVRLELYRESFLIDFGFSALEPSTETAAGG